MASGHLRPDLTEMPPAPPPTAADLRYGLIGPTSVYPGQPGPTPSVAYTSYGNFQTQPLQPGYSQPTKLAWVEVPPSWSSPVPSQPVGYVYGPPSPWQQQPQQQVFVIGAAGPPTAVPAAYIETFVGQIVLSCFVFWCCNLPLGLIAFILAMVASDKVVNDPDKAHSLGKASYGVSIAGLIVTAVIIVIVVGVVVGTNARPQVDLGSSSTTCNYYYYNSVCYKTYARVTMSYCTTYLKGYYAGSNCYYN